VGAPDEKKDKLCACMTFANSRHLVVFSLDPHSLFLQL
jgi:hypothetical protein